MLAILTQTLENTYIMMFYILFITVLDFTKIY
jgi:hypothetical protein